MPKRRYPAPQRVVLAVLTYQRNEAIAALIPHLIAQARSIALPTSIIVVDNDPRGGARGAVERFEGAGVEYVHEPKPGIAHGRNAALQAAGNADLLVFIDDDETPTAQWLQLMMKTFDEYECVGVVGNVKRVFDMAPDSWVLAGGFFDKPEMPTGTPQPAASTANLLLDLRFLRQHGLQFDNEFGLSGGSDTLLTRQVVAAGGKLIWCAEAIVIEQIPEKRVSRRWVVTRHFRVGNTSSQTALAMGDSRWERLSIRFKSSADGVVRVAGGGARSLWGKATRNLEHDAKGMRTAARGAGMLSGAVGYHYDKEYRKLRKNELGSAPTTPAIDSGPSSS